MSNTNDPLFDEPATVVPTPTAPEPVSVDGGGRGRRNRDRPVRDPRDPAVLIQNERMRLLRVDGRRNPTTSDDMPVLPRLARGGPDHFSALGLRAVARRQVRVDDVVDARQDVAFVLAAAFRPGADRVHLSTWVRFVGGDVSPMFSPGQVYPADTVGLVRIGYTDRTLLGPGGIDRGRQVAAVVYKVEIDTSVPDEVFAAAIPVAAYDLTVRQQGMVSDLAYHHTRNEPVMSAVLTMGGFNLADTVRRFARPEESRYGRQSRAATGPLCMVPVYGPDTGADGVPTESTYAVWSAIRYEKGPAVGDATSAVMLSFNHLGPVCFDRGTSPVVGMVPWTVAAGNVLESGSILGDVHVLAPNPVPPPAP